jgi:predicted MFS family arabinose efflux permease
MILARAVTGIFGGLISAQVLSIIADIIPYERRGQAMGMLMGGFALASVVGVPLGLYLANQFNWYFPFLVVAGLGVLLLPLLMRYVPNVRGHLANPIPLKGRIESFVHIFSDRTQMTALAFSFILIMGHFLIIPLFNPYMVYNVGVPQKDTPLIYLFGGISSLITAQFVGKLADKYGKRQVFVIAAAASLILILMVANMPRIPVYWVLIIFSVWFSAATGRTVPGQAMTTQAVTAKTRGSFMSLNSCMQSLGTGFAGLLSGWLTFSDASFAIHHYDYLGYLSAILILICIALAIRLDKLLVVNGLK